MYFNTPNAEFSINYDVYLFEEVVDQRNRELNTF